MATHFPRCRVGILSATALTEQGAYQGCKFGTSRLCGKMHFHILCQLYWPSDRYMLGRFAMNAETVGRMLSQFVQKVPIVGIGGIATLDGVMEFLVAGASAVQLGTVNFYDPTASVQIVEALPEALAQLGAGSARVVVGSLR